MKTFKSKMEHFWGVLSCFAKIGVENHKEFESIKTSLMKGSTNMLVSFESHRLQPCLCFKKFICLKMAQCLAFKTLHQPWESPWLTSNH